MSTPDPPAKNSPPHATVPILDAAVPNETLTLYKGAMQFIGDDLAESGDGDIQLTWIPRPRLRFQADVSSGTGDDWLGATNLQLSLSGEHEKDSLAVDVTNAAAFSIEGPLPIGGNVEMWERNPAEPVSSVVAHFVNLRQFRGSVLRHERVSYVGRAVLESSEWSIELDEIYKPNFFKRLKRQQAFGITHAARIRRRDGSAFCLDTFDGMNQCLNDFCSFVNGDWCGPIWLVGLGDSDEQNSHRWRLPRASGYRDNHNWFSPIVKDTLAKLFPGFVELWNDDVWHETLRNTIFWYVTSMSAGMPIENTIVLAQIAFETLGWTYFVEYKKSLSAQGFEKLNADDKLRLLLAQLDIPGTFPPRFSELLAYAKADNHEDAATTLTRLRNMYIHPSPKNRSKLKQAGIRTQYEARALCLYFLELIVLRLCRYNGEFSSRITDAEWRGGEVRRVPWAEQAPAL